MANRPKTATIANLKRTLLSLFFRSYRWLSQAAVANILVIPE